jgi:hypothetical protein
LAFAIVVVVRTAVFVTLHLWSVHDGQDGFGFIAVGGGDDGRKYYRWATDIVNGVEPHSLRNGFPTVLSWLMRLGVDSLLGLKIVNMLVGLAAPLLAGVMATFATVDPDAKRQSRALAILAVGLYPTAVYTSANSLLRDGWIFVGFLAAALAAARVVTNIRRRDPQASRGLVGWIAVFVAGAAFTAWFRPYSAVVLILGVAAFAVSIDPRVRRAIGRSPARVVITVVITVSFFFLFIQLARGPIDAVFGWDPLEYRAQTKLVGGSNFGLRYGDSPAANVGLYAYSLAANVLAPLPWQISTPEALIPLILETPILVALVVILVKRRSALRGNGSVRLWLAMAITWFAIVSVWNDNAGAAIRLRAPGVILLAICATVGLTSSTNQRDDERRVNAAARGG